MQTRRLPLSFHGLLNLDRMLINFAHQLLGFWIVMGVMTLFHVQFAIPRWEFLPDLALVVSIGFLLSFPVGMISARYRDVNYFIGFILQMAFMLTPVLWHRSQLPVWLHPLADYNPLAHMMEILRQPLLGHPPLVSDLMAVLLTWVVSAVLAVSCLALFRRRVVFWL
jgi:ABC-type polysaccharide/polyol phosphate export permease